MLDIYRATLGPCRSSENALTVPDQRQADEDTTQVPTTFVGRLVGRGGEHVRLKNKYIDKVLATIGNFQVINGEFRHLQLFGGVANVSQQWAC